MDMPGKFVFIVRHGQRGDVVHPDYRKDCFNSLDAALTDLGALQANRTKLLIQCISKSHGPYTVISSPFLGCIQTASEIQENWEADWSFADFLHILSYPMNILEELSVKSQWFAERFGRVEVKGEPPRYPEEIEEMKRRVRNGFAERVERFEGEVLIIVTHLMPLEVISGMIKGEDVRLVNDGFCCVTVAKYFEGKFTPIVIADHTHAPQYIKN